MSHFNNAQWPFLPTDSRPLFYHPEPEENAAPTYTGPWMYANQELRKRRRGEEEEEPATKDSAEAMQPAYKVRVTPALRESQNERRFRISDVGDYIVLWLAERLTTVGCRIASFSMACVDEWWIAGRHQRLSKESKGPKKYCRHVKNPERVETEPEASRQCKNDGMQEVKAKQLAELIKLHEPRPARSHEPTKTSKLFEDVTLGSSSQGAHKRSGSEAISKPQGILRHKSRSAEGKKKARFVSSSDVEFDATAERAGDASYTNLWKDFGRVHDPLIANSPVDRPAASPTQNSKPNQGLGPSIMKIQEQSRATAPQSAARSYQQAEYIDDLEWGVIYIRPPPVRREVQYEMTGGAGPSGTLNA